MKIKKEIERSKINTPLFIIHNLITYTSVQQVQEYINDFLLKSATFTLEEGHKVSTKVQEKTGIYYYESNKDQKIFHLIFANEGSEAGKYYNQFTLDFLENNYQAVTHLKNYDVIETIKDRFIKLSKDIIEKTDEKDPKLSEEKSGKANGNNTKNSHEDKTDEEIPKLSFDDSNPELIKLKDEKEIILKKCLTDELGFSNLKANGFEPTYNLFRKDNKIIVRVEAAGNCKLESEIEFAGEYNIIKLRGEKKKDKEPKNEKDNLFNTREYGSFSLEIPLKTEDYLLSNDGPQIDIKKGIVFLEYNLAKKAEKKGFETTEDDEI
jgi:HSP20 family molecular chaperone IbpA